MISIGVVPFEEYEEIKNFVKDRGHSIKLEDHHLIMAARERDHILGVAVAVMYQDYALMVDIITIEEDDGLQLDYGLGKAILNAIDLKGIMDVYCCNNNLGQLLIKLKFKEVKKDHDIPMELKQYTCFYHLSLQNYFNNHCCKK